MSDFKLQKGVSKSLGDDTINYHQPIILGGENISRQKSFFRFQI